MSIWVDVARVAAALNVLLLLALGSVWLRNYLQLRSKHTLGMLVFASMLFFENAFALYIYLVDPKLTAWFSTSVPDIAWQAMLTLHVLETLGIAFLTWVTMD
jgi:hypothetical protein